MESKTLRKKGLIEGKSPNLYISSTVAKKTGEQSDYMKMKGIDDDYIQKMIIDYLTNFKTGKRSDFEEMLLDKLPSILDEVQKKNKVRNILQKLKKDDIIHLSDGRDWSLSK